MRVVARMSRTCPVVGGILLVLWLSASAHGQCAFEWRALGTAPNDGVNNRVYALTV